MTSLTVSEILDNLVERIGEAEEDFAPHDPKQLAIEVNISFGEAERQINELILQARIDTAFPKLISPTEILKAKSELQARVGSVGNYPHDYPLTYCDGFIDGYFWVKAHLKETKVKDEQ